MWYSKEGADNFIFYLSFSYFLPNESLSSFLAIVILNGRGGDSETGTNSAVGADKSKPLPIFCSDLIFSDTKLTILFINVSSVELPPIRNDFLIFDWVSTFLRLSWTKLGIPNSFEDDSSESDFSMSSPAPLRSETRITFYEI